MGDLGIHDDGSRSVFDMSDASPSCKLCFLIRCALGLSYALGRLTLYRRSKRRYADTPVACVKFLPTGTILLYIQTMLRNSASNQALQLSCVGCWHLAALSATKRVNSVRMLPHHPILMIASNACIWSTHRRSPDLLEEPNSSAHPTF